MANRNDDIQKEMRICRSGRHSYLVGIGGCPECKTIAHGEYARKHRDKRIIRVREWNRVNKDRLYFNSIFRTYGITKDGYSLMLDKQKSLCAICGILPDRRLVVDHCHKTGRVRGLLCLVCNRALGLFRDNPKVLNSAADYLNGK